MLLLGRRASPVCMLLALGTGASCLPQLPGSDNGMIVMHGDDRSVQPVYSLIGRAFLAMFADRAAIMSRLVRWLYKSTRLKKPGESRLFFYPPCSR